MVSKFCFFSNIPENSQWQPHVLRVLPPSKYENYHQELTCTINSRYIFEDFEIAENNVWNISLNKFEVIKQSF